MKFTLLLLAGVGFGGLSLAGSGLLLRHVELVWSLAKVKRILV